MSKFAQKVKRYYDAGVWTERMVRDAFDKGRITYEELVEILGASDEVAGDDGPKHLA